MRSCSVAEWIEVLYSNGSYFDGELLSWSDDVIQA